MRFITVFIAASAVAVRAITPSQITSALSTIQKSSQEATYLLNVVNANPHAPDVSDKVADGMTALNNVTALYDDLWNQLVADPIGGLEDILNAADTDKVTAAAKANGETITPLGNALVDILPVYKEFNLYRDGCDDGINIGITLIEIYTDLATRYPTHALDLLLEAVVGFVRVPLEGLTAVACFVPVEIPGFPATA